MGLNQREFAQEMGVSRVTIQRYESQGDDTNPSMQFLKNIKERGGYSIDWVITGRGWVEDNSILRVSNYEWRYGELGLLVATVLQRRLEARKQRVPFKILKKLFPTLFVNAASLIRDGLLDPNSLTEECLFKEVYEEFDAYLDLVDFEQE